MGLYGKPMGVGEILDRSFQLFRNNFGTAFLLMLLFYGPIYFLSHFATLDLNQMTLLPSGDISIDDSLDIFIGGDDEEVPVLMIILILLMPIYLAFVFPLSLTSHLRLIGAALEGKTIRFGDILRQSFHRYWPSVGNTMLFGLVLSAAYMFIFFAIVILFAIVGGTIAVVGQQLDFAADPFLSSPVFIVGFIIAYATLILFTYGSFAFCMIRFGFYLPAVVLEGESIGLGRSWHLTKGGFWRIFAVLLILSVVYSIFSLGIYALLIGVFKMSLIGHLLSVMFMLAVAPMMIFPYAVIYYDQRVRNDGIDLEKKLESANDI